MSGLEFDIRSTTSALEAACWISALESKSLMSGVTVGNFPATTAAWLLFRTRATMLDAASA